MIRYSLRSILLVTVVTCAACGGGNRGENPDAASDGDVADASAVDAAGPCSLALPQAVAGAMWANSEVYPTIGVQVAVAGQAVAVDVTSGASPSPAFDNGDGTWTAEVDVEALGDGTHLLTAHAFCGDLSEAWVEADLLTGTEGVQLTDYDLAGPATTPRIHRVDEALWVTWVARVDGVRAAWARQVDGAGRWLGDEPVALTADASDTLYARTAFGTQSVGVIYQLPGQPYRNQLRVVDRQGGELLAPVALDPPGWRGRPRGDIAFDGAGFVAVYRVNDASGFSEIHWIRVDEQTLAVTGPVVVASSGNGDPVAGFEPFVFLKVAALPDVSVVSFVRNRYDSLLDLEVPKAQVVRVATDGTVTGPDYLGVESDFTWHWEARVSRIGDEVVAYWTQNDLTDPAPQPPTTIFGTRTDDQGVLDPTRGAGVQMLDAPFDRADPLLLPHPVHPAVLLWTDLRSYDLNPPGQIELFAAPLDAGLVVGEHVSFPHARFIFNASGLHGVGVAGNVMMVWRDQRHGGGLADPRPEVFFETVWY